MIREELYHKTVNILVQAYFNDTLAHLNCCACAVGNIILRSNGTSPIINEDGGISWPYSKVQYCDNVAWYDVVRNIKRPDDYINKLIAPTGYNWNELAKIEHAFESVYLVKSEDEHMFNGLMAVIDVLDEIHDNKDQQITEKSKLLFAK